MAIQHPAFVPITQPDTNPCAGERCVHLCLTRPVNTTNAHGEWHMRLEVGVAQSVTRSQGVCHCPNGYEWHRVLGACRPRADPETMMIAQQPYMCDEMTMARCANDAMCFNGGVCDQETVTPQVRPLHL